MPKVSIYVYYTGLEVKMEHFKDKLSGRVKNMNV
jgi:hypothetical protein